MAGMWKLAAAVAALAALPAGCGGSEQGSATFRQDALAICAEANERIRAGGTPESFTQTQLFARQANDAVGDQIDELEELEPPPDQRQQFELYLASLEERRRILRRIVDAADRGSMPDLRTTGSELEALTVTAREQARAIGLGECEPRE